MEEKETSEIMRNSIKSLHGGSISEEELDDKVDAYLEERKNISRAKEAVHIQYLNGTIDENDFNGYEEKLKDVGLELSRFDDSGEVKNSLDDFLLASFVFVNEYVFSELYSDIKGNLKWDVIKFLLGSIYEKLKGKKYFRTQSGRVDEKNISFGLKVKLDKNTQFDFLCTDLDKESFNESLDKVLDFLKTKNKSTKYRLPIFVEYKSKQKEWVEIDMMKEIKKKIKKQEERRKKKKKK